MSNNNSNSPINSSSEDEPRTLEINSTAADYEKERQSRISANNAKLKSLGLLNFSKSLIPTPENRVKTRSSTPKSKRNVHKNDEYQPHFDRGSTDDDDDDDDGEYDDDFEEEDVTLTRPSRKRGRYKVKNLKSKSGKKVSTSNPTDIPVDIDEDEALKQAIALSLASSQKLNTQTASVKDDNSNTQRRKKKLFSSRVQMTDDDLVIHFCQIDEAGKGGITLRDVARMAATHDFPWTEEELSDMIHCFDSDHDGKLTLDDFRNIAQRCNMFPAQAQS